ncbi:MAG: hypothetical protein BMS9Abin01_1992 [Gammaproteobacteria bacterium]|nr:MAG: hypothetical protein BMS9Abin01_1992 [Gammaproteobacteria bacterium]
MLCALLLAVPGLGQGASDDEDPTAQLSRLQSLMFDYADKYMSGIAQATFEVRQRNPTDPELRLRMHSLKLVVTASVQQLAVSPNPESTLLDMMVFATLHRMAIEEDWSRKLYGDGVDTILPTMRVLEKEIWGIASSYLSKTQIAEVRKLIRDWKAKYPGLKVVSYIRFSDFASLRSKSPLVDKARSRGFLVDTSGAERAVDEALLLAERVLHYSQRLPWIIEWQVEKVFYQLAVEPEFRQTLAQTQGMTRSLDRFADSMEKLPQQMTAERRASIEQMASAIATERSAAIRELGEALAAERRATIEDVRQSISTERVALFAEVDVRQKMLAGAMSEVRAGLADADKLTVNLQKTASGVNEALINADKLMARFDSGSEGGDAASEPFDINSYANAIKELTVAIREANTLLLSTERLTGGEGTMGGVFNRVLWTGTILILILCVAVFITMLIYRAAARHIVARSAFEPVGPPPGNT